MSAGLKQRIYNKTVGAGIVSAALMSAACAGKNDGQFHTPYFQNASGQPGGQQPGQEGQYQGPPPHAAPPALTDDLDDRQQWAMGLPPVRQSPAFTLLAAQDQCESRYWASKQTPADAATRSSCLNTAFARYAETNNLIDQKLERERVQAEREMEAEAKRRYEAYRRDQAAKGQQVPMSWDELMTQAEAKCQEGWIRSIVEKRDPGQWFKGQCAGMTPMMPNAPRGF